MTRNRLNEKDTSATTSLSLYSKKDRKNLIPLASNRTSIVSDILTRENFIKVFLSKQTANYANDFYLQMCLLWSNRSRKEIKLNIESELQTKQIFRHTRRSCQICQSSSTILHSQNFYYQSVSSMSIIPHWIVFLQFNFQIDSHKRRKSFHVRSAVQRKNWKNETNAYQRYI